MQAANGSVVGKPRCRSCSAQRARYSDAYRSTRDHLIACVVHVSPFLLTKLLLDRLKESAPARIITTASHAHYGAHIPFDDLNAERSYRGFGRYCETKLAPMVIITGVPRPGRDDECIAPLDGGDYKVAESEQSDRKAFLNMRVFTWPRRCRLSRQPP